MLSAHPLHILNNVEEKPGTMSLLNINRSAVFGHLLVFSQYSEVDTSQKALNSDGPSENKSEIFLLGDQEIHTLCISPPWDAAHSRTADIVICKNTNPMIHDRKTHNVCYQNCQVLGFIWSPKSDTNLCDEHLHCCTKNALEIKINLTQSFACSQKKNKDNLGASTSRPMMTIAGSGRSHGATLAQAIAGGHVHNSTSVVATINCKSLVTSSSLSTQD